MGLLYGNMKLSCRLFREIEENAEKFTIDVSRTVSIENLKKQIKSDWKKMEVIFLLVMSISMLKT
jgi:hypothetical protein